MSVPGEVNHIIGKAYVSVLNGCLEHTIKTFEKIFGIYSNPEKLSFNKYGEEGEFSFDSSGIYRHTSRQQEVFIESKGYTEGSSLTPAYKSFIAKAYITTVLNQRHSKDLFWFVTNVPFATKVGRNITSKRYLLEKILNKQAREVSSIIGDIQIDQDHVESLSKRLCVCFFTDSFIKFSGLKYKVRKGESLWTIMEDLHANRIPNKNFNEIGETVQRLNPPVKDANHIVEGERLHLPWYGIERD